MGRTRFRAILYRKKGQWRWRIVSAANGRRIANGGESYRRRIDAVRMLELAMDGFGCQEYEVQGNV
jgi:uncharacterized protein YegP (UPF0339 family)